MVTFQLRPGAWQFIENNAELQFRLIAMYNDGSYFTNHDDRWVVEARSRIVLWSKQTAAAVHLLCDARSPVYHCAGPCACSRPASLDFFDGTAGSPRLRPALTVKYVLPKPAAGKRGHHGKRRPAH